MVEDRKPQISVSAGAPGLHPQDLGVSFGVAGRIPMTRNIAMGAPCERHVQKKNRKYGRCQCVTIFWNLSWCFVYALWKTMVKLYGRIHYFRNNSLVFLMAPTMPSFFSPPSLRLPPPLRLRSSSSSQGWASLSLAGNRHRKLWLNGLV